jgi:peroxiredoxin
MIMEKEIVVGSIAQDFELTDVTGKQVKLSQFLGQKNVVLVFNRGFA